MVDLNFMTRVFCHYCSARFTVRASTWSGRCEHCGSSFTEILGTNARDQPRGQPARATGGSGSRTNNPTGRIGRQRSTESEEEEEEEDGALANNPMMMRLFSSLLEDYISGNGGINIDTMGSMGEAWMEQVAAQLMDEYQPTSFPTAARIVSALPTYNVRPRSAKGDPGPGEAFACAGEPCSVCHDEFIEKSKVVELCCSHCFHADCIKPWLGTHNTCPVCRIELETEGE